MLRVVTETDVARLAVVLGANCKRLRREAGVTQDQLALHARRYGLKWAASKVGDFEAGRARTAPTFATVLVLCLALEMAMCQGKDMRTRRRVDLADLVQFDGFVKLTETFAPIAAKLAEVCKGSSWPDLYSADIRETSDVDRLLSLAPDRFGEYGMRVTDVDDMRRRSDQDEYRLAKRLEIDADRLLAESYRLWEGRTFSEQRDRLAGPDANAQKRGRISRELRAQLEKAMIDGDD
jgi:transcriptional regulator with XRE-family HTH domain